MKIAIVGSGVIGLSVACRLARLGHRVTVISGQDPLQTTSAVSAAYWGPYFVGDYERNWAIQTWHELVRLASSPDTALKSGTSMVEFHEWLVDSDRDELDRQLLGQVNAPSNDASLNSSEPSLTEAVPYWWRDLPGVDFCVEPLLPPESIAFPDLGEKSFTAQIRFRSVVARMPDYLRWLKDQSLAEGNVEYVDQWISAFEPLFNRFDCVVNCTGWGAKRLVPEDLATANMRLLAGLVVRVDAPDQRIAISLGHGAFAKQPLYIIPRTGSQRDSICGGTAIEIPGDIDPRDPFPIPIDDRCDAIFERCSMASSAIRTGTRCENLAGLRPMRSSVRIEADHIRPQLIHCYGHGGSGLTLSWGSAERVCELVNDL
jgi:D-amino-acid oxidase